VSDTRQAAQAGDTPTPGSAATGEHVPTIDRIWRFLSSMRLAIGLILGIAGLSLVGVLVAQAPAGMTTASEEYLQWLQRVRPRYGAWTDLLSALQLFTVASSIWMRVLLALLAVSTFVCTLNRWPRIWSTVFAPTVRVDDEMLAGLPARREGTVRPRGEPQGELVATLSRRGYRVRVERDEAATYVYADRFRHARLGTLVAHFALVGILAGTVASSLWGFRDDEFVIPEGSTRSVGFGTTLSVRADAFVDEYYEAGGPKDYRSDIVLLDRGIEVARKTIRVNDPLIYGGIRFHQSFYGPAVVMDVRDATGNVLYQDGVAMPGLEGIFHVTGTQYVAQLIGPSGDPADTPAPGQIRADVYTMRAGRVAQVGSEILTLGQPKEIAGLTYTFVRERQFTGLSVVSDPGAPIIWITSALFVLGMAATFYFPFPRVWARFSTAPSGGLNAIVAGTQGRGGDFRRELDGIVRDAHGWVEPRTPLAVGTVTADPGPTARLAKRSGRR